LTERRLADDRLTTTTHDYKEFVGVAAGHPANRPSLLRLVLRKWHLLLLRASSPLHPRAGLRGQVRHFQTEEPNLSPVEAVRVYKELSEVERAFASLKDVIEMRPIHHRTAERVQAHIFVASLALLIHRAIEKKLKSRVIRD
jgi:transposase